MALNDALQALRQTMSETVPADIRQTMQAATEALIESGISGQALKAGDHLPAFELPNAMGRSVSSRSLLERGPLVVNFYRGAWCPYCNLELRAYQEALPEIERLGAQVVAISPNRPDHSLSTIEKQGLAFEVLSDLGNRYARECGLVFSLGEELRDVYQGFGIDLSDYNGDNRFELPLPATFVVDSQGRIRLAYVEADYTQRLEPERALSALREIGRD